MAFSFVRRRREQRQVIKASRVAVMGDDFEGLLRVLDPDLRLTVDTASGTVVPSTCSLLSLA